MERGAAERFCPYCGQGNAAEYEFCQRCGRRLPTPVNGREAAVVAPSEGTGGFPPTAEVPIEAASVRPLNNEERRRLVSLQRRPRLLIPRATGLVLSGGTLVLGLLSLIGWYPESIGDLIVYPEIYGLIVMMIAVIGMAISSAGRRLRLPTAKALAAGVAKEVQGVPARFDVLAMVGSNALARRYLRSLGMTSSVTVGSVSFLLSDEQTLRLKDGVPNSVTYVESSAPAAFLLDVNGQPLAKPETCAVAPAAGGFAAAMAAGVGFGRGRR